jgi:H+/Cl- antiporter ClcA
MTARAGAAPDPQELLRSSAYLKLLVLAAAVGVPVSAAAYGFLKLVAELQQAIFHDLPTTLGFDAAPTWWPLPVVAAGGLLVAIAIRALPGKGGHSPADGFKASGPFPPREVPGVFAAALATLAFGVVLGPEAPLILMGSGLGVLAVRLASKDAPPNAAAVVAAAGSFAAISSLLGSPLLGAFLLLEASGLSAAMLGVVLVPGLLAAGIGSLIFLGLDSITGYGTFSLALPGLPAFDHLTGAMFGWALVFGGAAAFVGVGIRRLALSVRPLVQRRPLVLTPVVGLLVGGLAVLFAEITGHDVSNVLFSGQDQLPGVLTHAPAWSVGAVFLLCVCKGLAYALSLSSFRGGPVFPAMFLGAAAGIAADGLPGLSLVPAVAMGIGAMCTVMLSLPLTSTLLATLLLGSDGIQTMPVVIVAVVVAYVVTARLSPSPAGEIASPSTDGRHPNGMTSAGGRAATLPQS